MTGKSALIADIGGTNARFAIVDNGGVHALKYLACKDYESLSEAATTYLKDANFQPDIGVFAVAGPVNGDLINITALPWTFSTLQTQQDLKLKHLAVMNDFEAVALAIPDISETLVQKICGDDVVEKSSKGVIGPGTGLGVASLFWNGNRYSAQAGEGGHVTMPFVSDREMAIGRELLSKYRHISAERVCSGKGMLNVYAAIRNLDKLDLPDLEPEEISRKAISGECAACKETLDLMLAFLGRIAGNLALTLGARGGIYIAGGIPTKLGDYFFHSKFVEEFQSKGRMSDFVKSVPVYMIKHDALGLLGLEKEARYRLSV